MKPVMAGQSNIPIELPAALTHELNHLRRHVGVEPELIELAPRRWRIVVRNERVYMDVDYRSASRDRIVWLRSALIVDGKRRKRARNCEHFARIFHDPDNELPPMTGDLDPPLPTVDPTTAPVIVQMSYRKLAAAIGAENVHIGHESPRWMVSVSKPGRALRMNFVRQGKKIYPAQRLIQVVIDGRDYSRQVNNQLEDAVALLSAPGAGPDTPGSTGSPEQGTGFGPVDVRQHSVMRN